MPELRFEWDEQKSLRNQRQHGVSFEEARTVFLDEHALLIPDPDHAGQDDRFILLGLSAVLRVLVVCHCYRSGGHVIRLISAREADNVERSAYHHRKRT
jgi:uncharacterized DUF497 family protein